MSFITVWGFGNVVNNYANQGLVVVFSWVFIFALYFTPYALIVGQLGSTFKDGKGGVSTGIKHTIGPRTGLPRRVDLLGGAYSLSGTKTPGDTALRSVRGDERRRFANQRIYSVVAFAGVNAGAVYLLYVGCFTRYEIAENRTVLWQGDCDVCYVAPVCGDGGNRACDY